MLKWWKYIEITNYLKLTTIEMWVFQFKCDEGKNIEKKKRETFISTNSSGRYFYIIYI